MKIWASADRKSANADPRSAKERWNIDESAVDPGGGNRRWHGRFSCVETAQGPGGPPVFPLPWAINPSASCLATPEAMRAAVEQAGLRTVAQINFAAEVVKRGDPPYQANDVVMGDDFELRRANPAGLRGVFDKRILQRPLWDDASGECGGELADAFPAGSNGPLSDKQKGLRRRGSPVRN